MLALDWRFALADKDRKKVIDATVLAGEPVGFPILDDTLTDFSPSLEHKLKLKTSKLRWFFKELLRDFLPDDIITRKKHRFGLPFGVWVNRDPDLRVLAVTSIRGLAQRAIVRPDDVERLVAEQLPQHPS